MIWYRHWLEMRYRAALGLGIVFAMSFSLRPVAPRSSDATVMKLLGVDGARAWTGHAVETLMLVLVLAGFAASNGIVSHSMGTRTAHRSTYYTLGLPVARARLYATRFAAGWLMVCLGFVLSFAVNCASFSWHGNVVPWRAMAIASAAGVIATLPAMAFINLLVLIFGATVGPVAGVVATLLSVWGFVAFWGGSTTDIVPWVPVAAALSLTALLFAATVALLRRWEF